MLFLLSPAKSLDYDTPAGDVPHTLPAFASQAAELIEVLRPYSPQQNYQRNKKINSELLFPNFVKVKPMTGAADAVLGLNILSGVITEINFMPTHKDSVRLQYSDKDAFDVGYEMYRNLRNRIIGRFSTLIKNGEFIGRLIIDSARDHVGDFTDKKLEEAKRDPSILIIQRSLWDARAHEYPADEPRFPVELGNDFRPPRILAAPEDADDADSVIIVPTRHRIDFENDIEQALKDLAGVPSSASGRFLPFPREISAAQSEYMERSGGLRLFRMEEINLKRETPWYEILDFNYIEQLKLEGDFNYAVHVDTSLGAHDAAGLAVGRISGKKIIQKGHFYDPKQQEVREFQNIELPIYCIDGALRITAPKGEHIDLLLLKDLVVELSKHLNVKYAGADWIESASMLQSWRNAGIVAGKISVDKTPDAYFEVRHALKDGRLLFSSHATLDKELRELKRLVKQGNVKIDHPPNGSKDVADALAGVVSILKRMEGRARVVEHEELTDDSDDYNMHQSYSRTGGMSGRQRPGWGRW
jgi:hypothetical protein